MPTHRYVNKHCALTTFHVQRTTHTYSTFIYTVRYNTLARIPHIHTHEHSRTDVTINIFLARVTHSDNALC